MPDLVRYQIRDGPHAGEPATERGEIERLARECRAAACRAGLDSTVFETRFNVVRSSMPDLVTTARTLRDYLSPEDRPKSPVWADQRGSILPAGLAPRPAGAEGRCVAVDATRLATRRRRD